MKQPSEQVFRVKAEFCGRVFLLPWISHMCALTEATVSEELRYPVGRYRAPDAIGPGGRAVWIGEIEALPEKLRRAVAGLSETQLDTPYRPGGWTVRQVVHHYADSHLNSYSRFRWAVTEDVPGVKTYDEAAWAELADAKTAPVELSLALIEPLHARWALLLRSFDEAQFARKMKHPDWGEVSVEWLLGQYAWHCRHHVAHIQRLREREGW